MTHIRCNYTVAAPSETLCGASGSSVSSKHYNEQKDHIISLLMCPKCEEIANGYKTKQQKP
jgi:hypothetical protein